MVKNLITLLLNGVPKLFFLQDTSRFHDGFVARVTISQRSLLNKLHLCRKIILCHKTHVRDNTKIINTRRGNELQIDKGMT